MSSEDPSSGFVHQSTLEPDQLQRLRTTLDAVPESIGPYLIDRVIGEGGFGVVYLAHQSEPVRRSVAIKIIKPGMDSRAVLRRFDLERQSLASMNHPAIARVIDAGTTPEARPYFVMEYVDGVPITRWSDEHNATTRERIDLFLQVCEAIQHAHHKGIIHRDIKPSNVLVTSIDDKPQVKMIDFGVAKALGAPSEQTLSITAAGMVVGTPEYMSPEQAGFAGDSVDMRSDIYAMGVLLYELLTGQLPFEGAELRKAAFDEMCRIIRENDVPRPSTRLHRLTGTTLAELAQRRALDPNTLIRQLRNELEWIPLKALRKVPAERYRSAAEMGDDLRNYIAGRALIAGPELAMYKFKKFVRRHRGPVVASSLFLLALVGGVVGTSVMAVHARKAQDAAEQQRAEAEKQRGIAEEQRAVAERGSNRFATLPTTF